MTKFVKKIQAHTVYFFFAGNRAVYVVLWKNMVQLDRPQMAI
jgi:hypothetical protein